MPTAAKKTGTKRGDAKGGAPPAKKPRADPNLAGVAAAIEQACDLPEGCRKMLLACFAQALGTPRDERHEAQTTVVQMIDETVRSAEAKLKAAVDCEHAKVSHVDARKSELQAKLTETETGASAAEALVRSEASALAQASEAATAASAALQEAQKAQREGDADLRKAQESKTALEQGIAGDLQAIVEGLGESEQMEQHYKALLPLLTDLGLDESLSQALPSTCAKKASERGAFDAMVLDQLGASLRERVASLARAVEEATPPAQERAAAVEAAQAQVSATTGAQEQAAKAAAEAGSANETAAAARQAAGDALTAFEPEYTEATRVRDEKGAALENFQQYNVACFELLRDKTASAKAKVPEADVEAEAKVSVAVAGA